MKVDDNPFLGDQNMVDARLLKGKTKILTSTKSREARTVDPKMQISADEYREIKRHRDKAKEPIWARRNVKGRGDEAASYILNSIE